MQAKIYQPARNAMTSGQAKTRDWVLEYTPAQKRSVDPLMGWTSSGDMASQVRLRFPTREAAVDYAEKNGMKARAPARPVLAHGKVRFVGEAVALVGAGENKLSWHVV